MARTQENRAGGGARSNGRGGNAQKQRRNGKPRDEEGILPVLARAVREVESRAQRRHLNADQRTTFQVVAMLAREERTRVKADTELSEARRAEQLKRLDGIATILAKTATTDSTLFTLLGDDVEITADARALRREMLEAAGMAVADERPAGDPTGDADAAVDRQVVPRSVVRRQLANPFQPPEYVDVTDLPTPARRLASWELLGPLFESFERAADGKASSMELPEPVSRRTPSGLELMEHQAELVAAAEKGHRTFLLADEPGLGKTAQALLAAQAARAFPLLVVVPNVVKSSWVREARHWTPGRTVTAIHGDGHDLDAFADVVVVNYDVLDRHVGWLGEFGFRGMVVDEAHFIKNRSSQRSRNVLRLSQRIRERRARPLLMALTGTPLINDIEDFRAIWQFLGWIDEKAPTPCLMGKLEDTGLTPIDHQFSGAARRCVIDMGIVRRRKVDVASDIPARRVADLPVELDDEVGRSIKAAERELATRMVGRYDAAMAARGTPSADLDLDLVHAIAVSERKDSESSKTGENVFGMMRRIGRAKAGLAADYTAQLAHSVGKVVFFAKHIDVMDAAEDALSSRGIRYTSIRGDQTAAQRQAAIDGFTTDPDVQVVVCSLMAAGVGLNLQVASDVVLAELSWTDAEQTQAIDRVHRIGQDRPVTAWRIIAAQTIDARIAELIDSKAGLASRALDGTDDETGSSADVQVQALEAMLVEALRAR
ncbi:DEAD/DEAH box helicase [Nocardioides sp. CFH 31398]|uniref:DEAD/DEAH box helicase n=1 Tax=Nocardioides sp. CFH 31398 TaxID=2919579 RepID=UPI001F06E027|nr:DEAD/DEAH box helicase [Nocardioides sp. CFH 31398]MCH1865661.1 DEAD/DEAH box helicase [Nocardioides sp. CFH 31398]